MRKWLLVVFMMFIMQNTYKADNTFRCDFILNDHQYKGVAIQVMDTMLDMAIEEEIDKVGVK